MIDLELFSVGYYFLVCFIEWKMKALPFTNIEYMKKAVGSKCFNNQSNKIYEINASNSILEE